MNCSNETLYVKSLNDYRLISVVLEVTTRQIMNSRSLTGKNGYRMMSQKLLSFSFMQGVSID